MSETLLVVGFGAVATQYLLTGLAATAPELRPWPPDELSGRFGLYWLLVMGTAAPFFGLVATTAGSLYPVGPASLVAGGVFLAGAAVNVLAADEMDDPAEVLGLELSLHTGGPFRLARRPEVAGHAGAVGGLALAAGSWQALALAAAVVGWFLLRPLAEEPVMAERFGTRYDRYRSRVARYGSLDALRGLLRD